MTTPTDIAITARIIATRIFGLVGPEPALIIAEALLAERRRCADCADFDAHEWRVNGFPAQAMGAVYARNSILSEPAP